MKDEKNEINLGVCVLRMSQVQKKLNMSRALIYKLLHDGDLPKPLMLGGGRAVGWLCSELDEWLATRLRKGGA